MNTWKNIAFIAGEIIDNCIWVSECMFNGFFKVDLRTGQSEYLGQDETRPSGCMNCHLASALYKNRVFFFDYDGSGYTVFDVMNNEKKHVRLSFQDQKGFFSVIEIVKIDEKRVLLLPRMSSQPLLEFNMETEEFVVLDYWNKEIVKCAEVVSDFSNNSILLQDVLWTVILGTNMLVSCNLKTKSIDVKILGEYEFEGVAVSGNKLLITCDLQCCCILYDTVTEDFETCRLPGNAKNLKYPYFTVCGVNNGYFVMPAFGVDDIVFVDDAGNYQVLDRYIEGFEYIYLRKEVPIAKFFRSYIYDNKVYLYPSAGNMLLIIDISTRKISGIPLYLPEVINGSVVNRGWVLKTCYPEYYENCIQENGYMEEGIMFDLEYYLSVCEKSKSADNIDKRNNIGSKIWEVIR